MKYYFLTLMQNFSIHLQFYERNYKIAMAKFSAKFLYTINKPTTHNCKQNWSPMMICSGNNFENKNTCSMLKIFSEFPQPKGSENHQNADKKHVKLFPNFPYHHLITHRSFSYSITVHAQSVKDNTACLVSILAPGMASLTITSQKFRAHDLRRNTNHMLYYVFDTIIYTFLSDFDLDFTLSTILSISSS